MSNNASVKPLYKGDISKVNIFELLIRLGILKENGYVEIILPQFKIRVYLFSGDIANVDSDNLDFSLAGFLKKKGMINDEQCSDADKLIKVADKSAADVILTLGFIKPYEMIQVINEFLICALSKIATLSSGQYIYYKVIGDVYPFPVNLRFNTVDAVKSVIFFHLPDEFFLKMFARHSEINIVNRQSGLTVESARLGPKELRYLRLICSTGKFRDFLPEIDEGDKDSLYKLRAAYYFKICSFIDLRRGDFPLESVFHVGNMEGDLPTECGGPVFASGERISNTGSRLNSGEERRVLELKSFFDKMKKSNFFERLGISEDSNDLQIKKAYISLAKQYHPDIVTTDSSPQIKKCYEDIFALINEAYQRLEKEESRKEYLSSIRQSKDGRSDVDISSILEEEAKFIKAKGLIKTHRNIETALSILEEIMTNNPDDEYKIYYLWGKYLRDKPTNPEQINKTIRALEEIGKKKEVPDLLLFLGYLYKAIKNEEKMIDVFRRLLRLEPNNPIASIEIKLYEKKKR